MIVVAFLNVEGKSMNDINPHLIFSLLQRSINSFTHVEKREIGKLNELVVSGWGFTDVNKIYIK